MEIRFSTVVKLKLDIVSSLICEQDATCNSWFGNRGESMLTHRFGRHLGLEQEINLEIESNIIPRTGQSIFYFLDSNLVHNNDVRLC